MGVGETGVRETGGEVSGGKATGAQVCLETGGKGDRLMGESVIDNSLAGDKAAGQNVMEGIQRKSCSEVAIQGVRVFVGEGNRKEGSEISKLPGMAINILVQKVCREEKVGFVDSWGSFVGKADMYMRDGLHLSGKGTAVFADELSAAVGSGMGSIKNSLVVNIV